jgi:pimeloyl-ACP methyl ester carboxylesterase
MDLSIDGKSVFVYTGGCRFDPEQQAIVFVHGAGLDHSVWLLQSRYFAHHGWSVAAPDLPGHGRSPGPALERIDAMAHWLEHLVEALGLGCVSLVGHSMGSLVVMEAAARGAARVGSIALLGTAFPMSVSETLLNAARTDEHAAYEMINVWGHGSGLGGNPVPGLWILGVNLRLLERAAPGLLYWDLKACNDYREGLERARSISCPALFLLGARDQMTPVRAAQSLRAAIPHAQTIVLEDCGHSMMTEQPDRVLQALAGFF